MTFLHRLRRTLAAFLTSLLVASGLALVPAALVSSSSAATVSSVSDTQRVNCTRLKRQVAEAERAAERANVVFQKRKDQLERAEVRYRANPTRRNRDLYVKAARRYEAAGNRKVAAEKRYYTLRERYLDRCTRPA